MPPPTGDEELRLAQVFLINEEWQQCKHLPSAATLLPFVKALGTERVKSRIAHDKIELGRGNATASAGWTSFYSTVSYIQEITKAQAVERVCEARIRDGVARLKVLEFLKIQAHEDSVMVRAQNDLTTLRRIKMYERASSILEAIHGTSTRGGTVKKAMKRIFEELHLKRSAEDIARAPR